MDLSFSLLQILAFAALFQCVSVLIYLIFRSGTFKISVTPILFFLNLSAALYIDFSLSFLNIEQTGFLEIRFWLWMLLCPLSILFILQVSDLTQPIKTHTLSALAPLTVTFLISRFLQTDNMSLHTAMDINHLCGAIGATLSLPFIWFKPNLLKDVLKGASGKERYFMILFLIGLSVTLISLVYSYLAQHINDNIYTSLRTVLGLLFVYASASYLFRIYPPPIQALLKPQNSLKLNDQEKDLIKRIDHKLEYEKVYLEKSYSRSDMAQELKISEGQLSKLFSHKYNKNFPSVLNDCRIKEACQLLIETDASINIIAEEVGFNSLASFNRVFKENVCVAPSKYRQQNLKEHSKKIG